MDGLRAGCLFFANGNYKSAINHIEKYLSDIDDKNENKPCAVYLLAECHQLSSKKKPTKAVNYYKQAIDFLLKERSNIHNANGPNQENNGSVSQPNDSLMNENEKSPEELVIGLVLDNGTVIDSVGQNLSVER